MRPILTARKLFLKYYSIDDFDFKKFRCDIFMMNIANDNNIFIDSHSFKSPKFCGLLTIDEFENTIVYNKNSPAYRRNFTIAHEFGHFFLHRHISHEFPDRASDLLNSSDNILEKQANAFAGEIVLPTVVVQSMLRSGYRFQRISAVTKTSHECLSWRLVRHLMDLYELPYNRAVHLARDFEESSFLGYKSIELLNFITNNNITRKK